MRNAIPTNIFRITRGKRELVRTGRSAKVVYTRTDSHWESATCERVGCTHYLQGWSIKLDFTPMQKPQALLMAQAADHKMRNAGKKLSERWEGSTCIYQFEAGQTCFQSHQIPIDRDPVFLHVTGSGQYGRMDYDEFFDTANEHFYRSHNRRERSM